MRFLILLILFTISGCESSVEVVYYMGRFNEQEELSEFPDELKRFSDLRKYEFVNIQSPIDIREINQANLSTSKISNGVIEVSKDTLHIKGIACDVPNGKSPNKVYIFLGNQLFLLISQQDTYEYAKTKQKKNYNRCGFEGYISMHSFQKGEYSIYFIVVTDDNKFYFMNKVEDPYNSFKDGLLRISII